MELFLFALGFLPIHLLIRFPFRRLPLHFDVGFYVSNHTIATGRFDFRQGWNARFAGCSKLFVEAFYSVVYLWCRQKSQKLARTAGYLSVSRLGTALFTYGAALLVGALAMTLFGNDVNGFYAGTVLFSLLSSEAHYGAYSECAELFEIPFQVGGLLCLIAGIQNHTSLWIVAGTTLWAIDVSFVKLSSAITAGILLTSVGFLHPWTIVPALSGALPAFFLYVLWVHYNGQTLGKLLSPLRGHEAGFDQRAGSEGFLNRRLREKAQCAFRLIQVQPLIPVLGLIGLGMDMPSSTFFIVFVAACLLTYVFQGADCRYYLIPLLPAAAIFATNGVIGLAGLGAGGYVILAVVSLFWLVHNPLRAARLSRHLLNVWCWKGFRPLPEMIRNLAVERACKILRPRINGRSVLVFGPYNQAYSLLHSAYATPLIAPEHYLDSIQPLWQRELKARWVSAPPDFIFDTSSTFQAEAARRALGVDYRLTDLFDAGFRWYEKAGVQPGSATQSDVLVFRPCSIEQLRSEERRAGSALVRHSVASDLGLLDTAVDPAALGLKELLNQLRIQGYKRLALYGAGRFTIRHAELFRNCGVHVSVVLDDRPDRFHGRFLDWPVRKPENSSVSDFDAIVISSDRFADAMRRRARDSFGERVPLFSIGA